MAVKTRESGVGFWPANQVAGWVRQGVDSFMAAQKILLDLTAQQNALVIGMLRERLSAPPRPDVAIAKIADKGVKNLSAAGKIMLDLAANETELIMDGVKAVVPLPFGAGTVAEVLRHRLVTLVDLQKRLLAAAADQVHEAAESYEEGKGLVAVGASAATLARKGIETFVETEKEFLDLAVKDVGAGTKAGAEERKPARDRYKTLTELAREGGEKYLEAQKKLLNLAIEEMEAVGKAGRAESAHAGEQTTWGELTEKGVRNFATAQKSLMDLVVKPVKGKTSAPERKRRIPRPRPRPTKEELAPPSETV